MEPMYLEINEELTETDLQTRQPMFLRIEVADKEDALIKLLLCEPFFTGRVYSKELHRCNHNAVEGCTTEAL